MTRAVAGVQVATLNEALRIYDEQLGQIRFKSVISCIKTLVLSI